MICLYLVVALFSCDLAQSRVPFWYKEIKSLLADDLSNNEKMVVATREGVEYTGTLSEIEDFLNSDLSKGQEMVFNQNFNLEDSMEKVFPPDTRQNRDPHTFPYSAMGKLNGCTGTFISAHVVLTAAHCLYGNGGYSPTFDFYRGRNCAADDYLSKHEHWSNVYTYSEWKDHRNYDYDIAWIVYDKASPEHVSYTSHMPPLMSEISINGYGRIGSTERCLWGSSDALEDIQTSRLYYKVDTTGGQSGSAIIYYERSSPVIIGVHSGTITSHNNGVRMTTQFKNRCDDLIATFG